MQYSRIAKQRGWIIGLVIVLVISVGLNIVQHSALLSLLDVTIEPTITQTDLEYAYNNDYSVQVSCDGYSLRFNK